jgi:hypothetical protein
MTANKLRLSTHGHAFEQSLSRTLNGAVIPNRITTVTIEGCDEQFGFRGAVFRFTLQRTDYSSPIIKGIMALPPA